jgi:hypothetical protein
VFLGIALLLGVSAEEKAKSEEKKPIVDASKPVEAKEAKEDDGTKKDKRGLFDHDFGGHDFSHSHSYSNIDFGHHHEEPHFESSHYEPHHHEEKTLTIVKKVPYPVPHVKEVHVPHVKEVSLTFDIQ